MTTPDARAAARYHQEVLSAYRAWRTYLEAQQVLLAPEGAGAADAFEGASAPQERRAQAQARLAALPVATLALFDAVLTQERHALQQAADAAAPVRGGTLQRADADAIARQAVDQLLADARGERRPDGRGLVPRGTPAQPTWLALDLRTLEGAPPGEADYQVAGGPRRRRRGLVLNLALAGLVVVLVPLVIWLLQPGAAPDHAGGTVFADGAALTPWPLVAVIPAPDAAALPLTTATAGWPAAIPPDAAIVRADGPTPLRLCLPAPALAAAGDQLTLLAAGRAPARRYALTAPAASDAPDLLLSACTAPATPVRAGVLSAVIPPPLHAIGERTPLGIAVLAVASRGPGEDPSLPSGVQEVTVTAGAASPPDWLALAPTLQLPSGEGLIAVATAPGADETARTFRYHVPLLAQPRTLVWQLQPPDQPAVWVAIPLAPPPSRDTVLRTQLQIRAVAVTPGQQTLRLTLTLQNLGATPLSLTAADLRLLARGTARPVAAPDLDTPLDPHATRALTLELPLEDGVLALGPFRIQLTVERR